LENKYKRRGRPKKTLQDLPFNWKHLIKNLAIEGASDVEIRSDLNISRTVWDRLIKENKEFNTAIKKAHELCKSWWMKEGRFNLQNTKFSPTLWYMNMKNRFGWTDRPESKELQIGSIVYNISYAKQFLSKEELNIIDTTKTKELEYADKR